MACHSDCCTALLELDGIPAFVDGDIFDDTLWYQFDGDDADHCKSVTVTEGSTCEPVAKQPASKKTRFADASTDSSNSSDEDEPKFENEFNTIRATIASLIAGETSIKRLKETAIQKLPESLANYDTMVDELIQSINTARLRIKRDMQEAIGSRIKQLDSQCDELAVSIGQLQGLALLLNSARAPGMTVMAMMNVEDAVRISRVLLKPFTKPTCHPGIVFTTPKVEFEGFLAKLEEFASVVPAPVDISYDPSVDGPPKRPATAYLLFAAANRARIKTENPGKQRLHSCWQDC